VLSTFNTFLKSKIVVDQEALKNSVCRDREGAQVDSRNDHSHDPNEEDRERRVRDFFLIAWVVVNNHEAEESN